MRESYHAGQFNFVASAGPEGSCSPFAYSVECQNGSLVKW